ncbi:hypothetical protein EJP82_20920 [Paenibacillus anaericanus]|uniref:Uncharacterized protein n=1 Tax=Paenibacillus anaericanus TaxID=170367 RepID=A0A433Y4N5_9BACL|nr:hypothetical protein [Paenibacillus anaericanus]RUT43279.1 hypothetical protein EJP82_20920 [Paenibacillus anaericanus]
MNDMEMQLRSVNMGQETFNDALKYVKEARECFSSNRYSSMWSASRSAMFNMCLSAESDLSKLIALSLKRIGSSKRFPLQRVILKNLTDKSKENQYPPDAIDTIVKKYNYLLLINDYKPASLPNGYREAANLRNKITHYSFSKNHSVYSMTIVDDIEKSLREIRNFILHIWSVSSLGTPSWVNSNEYLELDRITQIEEKSQ